MMPQLYVATNGLSVWSSRDLGETISRMPSSTGMYSGSQVWSLAVHPTVPGVLLAGTDSGVYRLDQAAQRWTHLPSPMDDMLVTALAFSPDDPHIILAGTQPSGLFRSDDAGETWTAIETGMKPFVASGFFQGEDPNAQSKKAPGRVKHWTRVTQIAFDTRDPNLLWAGVEIDGAWRSADTGKTWTRTSEGLEHDDVHGLAVMHNGGRLLFATTAGGLHLSRDDGSTWAVKPIDSPWQYVRSVVPKTDGSGTIFLTNGNGPPGSEGRLFLSHDFGETWKQAVLPGRVESSAYFLAAHPADPDLLFLAATLGQLYRSTDGGDTWTALPRRLGEVRGIAWMPG
jgi:photosystem II stability/assembly factor-like uncharacterized protein